MKKALIIYAIVFLSTLLIPLLSLIDKGASAQDVANIFNAIIPNF